ncbi:hypothetical protein L1987_48570 [Smallanthus sonchifolius]|uniref:Uncharacterized protein n=1 Tax=Smallanthus sonchifolius TaxID=185202 RepID=A0ACB9FSY8_9ASTR|nr:hypothetical protein L1987_48570 [Smallanthus sonchifolius]
MRNITIFIFIFIFILLVIIASPGCHASQDSLAKNGSIRDEDHDTLVSPRKVFQMGFFRSQIGNQRFLGIWYYMDPKTVVWVANRENPVSSTSSILTIEDDGNLAVKDKDNKYFATRLPSSSGSRTLKLLDTGNLILVDESNSWVWSSFSFPTDTFLPGMYMEKNMKLTSWKTQHNPATGTFVFQKDQVFGYNNYTIFDEKKLHWKSGFGLESSINPTKMPIAALHLLSRSNSTKTAYSRLVMNSSGEIQLYYWDLTIRRWVLNWSEPKDYCAQYNACGPNSSCDISKSVGTVCNCLPGFEAVSDITTTEKVCKRTSTICSGNDTSFLSMEIMKIDVTFQTFLDSRSEPECKEKCLGLDCCQAYSYNGVGNQELVLAGIPGGKQGCWIWSSGSQLVDVQIGEGVSGHTISIRNPLSIGSKIPQIANGNRKQSKSQVIILSAIVIPGVFFLCCIGFICYKKRVNVEKVKGNIESDSVHQFNESVRQVQELLDPFRSGEHDSPTIGIPFFDFERISASTDGFSDANKLGEGGFGPVYKGKLSGGLEVAVKRIIGTYGYMAPEYALEGLFSIKSDVYSFGVVVLEIISGKKKHYQCEQAISLLNYAWQLWKEGRPLDLMEQVLLESYDPNEVLKCIIVGLLCVQEDPDDRPNMSNVVAMITSDISTLPEPKQPAFIVRKFTTCYDTSSSSYQPQTQTNVEVTISTIQGR